jgi:chromosome partitioning protein
MEVVTVTNRKGGVGKSTVSAHLAAGLATKGKRVALVDTDSQGHAALALNLPQSNGLYDLIVDHATLESVIIPVPVDHYSPPDIPAKGALYLLPSHERTFRIPFLVDDPFIFGDRLKELTDAYALDFIIVDTNPTLSMFDGSIYLATDAFLYVTEVEKLAFDGVVTAMEHMKRFGRKRLEWRGDESRILGIVPNKVRAGTRNHRHNIARLADAFPGLVWSLVSLNTIWAEATNVEQLVYTYAPTSQPAADAWRLVDRVEKELATWQISAIS